VLRDFDKAQLRLMILCGMSRVMALAA